MQNPQCLLCLVSFEYSHQCRRSATLLSPHNVASTEWHCGQIGLLFRQPQRKRNTDGESDNSSLVSFSVALDKLPQDGQVLKHVFHTISMQTHPLQLVYNIESETLELITWSIANMQPQRKRNTEGGSNTDHLVNSKQATERRERW